MVLSSQTTMGMARHHDQTDVAACWGNLAGAAATGAPGCNSRVLPNPEMMLGDTDTGHAVTRATLPFWNDGRGRWERCNLFPTGGRQHAGDSMSSNGATSGDDRRAKGAAVLPGATWRDRRIAQASNAQKNFGCGVEGASGQNWMDTFRPSRDVDNVQAGKPRVRNICAAKGHFVADCTAKFAWVLIGLHLCASSQRKWITWEAAGYTSNTCVLGGRPGVGAAVSRFKPVKWEQSHQPGVLVRPGRKPPSVTGWASRPSGNICEDHGSNAERQDATGWPPNRQQLRQGDSWNGCGQKCDALCMGFNT